jgi:general secretion pathway protein D
VPHQHCSAPTAEPARLCVATFVALATLVLLSISTSLTAQPTQPTQPTTLADEMVNIDLPSDGVELRTLADIVTKRLGIPILYDETIANKRVVIRVPKEVPASSLLGVLQSALRMKGMMLVDAAQPGWKQIVPAPEGAAGGGAAGVGEAEVRIVPLKEADAATVAGAVRDILKAPESALSVWPDQRLNQVVIVAPKARADEIVKLIGDLDRPVEMQTKVYRLKFVSPERVDRLISALLGESAKRTYQSTADRESQSLVVSTTPAVHRRIEQLVDELDVSTTAERSPVKFYKLKNTKAADVLATIQDLLGRTDSSANGTNPSPGGPEAGQVDVSAPSVPSPRMTAANNLQPPQSQQVAPPAGRMPLVGVTQAYASGTGAAAGPTSQPSIGGVHTSDATVTADPNTNSIIVIAPPAVQQVYAELVGRLDQRRPQVQIECTLVTLDTSGNYSFGVDISKLGGSGTSSILTFSSFGIAKLDTETGQLMPVDARGGTFALIGPDVANIVLRALAQNSRSRLVSAPQLLVNDNGHGQLKSVSEQPFAEILDTSSSQARTSLGGFAQAGTTINVEPHISDGDYMQLSYAVELSNFTGAARNGLPPPSQRNQVESTVTIPDGSTIVVGGLSLKNLTEAEDSIPIINRIPILKWIIGTRSSGTTETTLFVFIRPTILRDDQFKDLKYISDRRATAAGIEGSYPSSGPIPLH